MWVLALRASLDSGYLNKGVVNNLTICRVHWLENAWLSTGNNIGCNLVRKPTKCLAALFAITRNIYAEMRFVVAKPALAYNTCEVLDCHQCGTLCAHKHCYFVAGHVDVDVLASNSCLCRTSEARCGK